MANPTPKAPKSPKLTITQRNQLMQAYKVHWFNPRANAVMQVASEKVRDYIYASAINSAASLVDEMSAKFTSDERAVVFGAISKRTAHSAYVGRKMDATVQALFHSISHESNYLECRADKDRPFACFNSLVDTSDETYQTLLNVFVRNFSKCVKDYLQRADQLRGALNTIKTHAELQEKFPKTWVLFKKEVLKTGAPALPVVIVDYAAVDALVD